MLVECGDEREVDRYLGADSFQTADPHLPSLSASSSQF